MWHFTRIQFHFLYQLSSVKLTGARFTKLSDDGEKEKESVPVDIQILENQVTYNVPSVTWGNNNGRYEFYVEYGSLRASVAQTVLVLEKPVITEFRQLKPFILAGKNVTIKSKVSGHPPPMLRWYHQKCCLSNETVLINDDNSGSYEIDGQNLKLNNVDGWGVAVESENTTLYENMGEFVLTCVIDENPGFTGDYTLNILLNGESLSTQTQEFGEKASRIVHNMRNARAEMEGVYQCVVTTDTFTLWSKAMRINFVPQPHFTVFPQNYTLAEGETAIFSCQTSGVNSSLPVTFTAGPSEDNLTTVPASEGLLPPVILLPIHGRYEENYKIFVNKGLSSTLVSLLIAGGIILVLILLLCMAVLVARHQNPRHTGSYDLDTCTVATNQALVKNEQLPQPSSASTSL
eukprot:sb/3465294/